MHERSILPFLWLFLSFEMTFSTPWLWFDQNSRRNPSKPWCVSSQTILVTRPSKPTALLILYAFGKYWMQARGYLDRRLKYCGRKLSPVVIYCICQPNEQMGNWEKKNWGAKQKSGAMANPGSHLESPLPKPWVKGKWSLSGWNYFIAVHHQAGVNFENFYWSKVLGHFVNWDKTPGQTFKPGRMVGPTLTKI